MWGWERALMKIYSFKPRVGPRESLTRQEDVREDLILIKGRFYYIDDIDSVQFFY